MKFDVQSWRMIRRLVPYMRKYQRGYLCLCLLMFIDIGSGLFVAWFLKNITEAATHQQLHRVLILLSIAGILCVMNGALVFANVYLTSRMVNRLVLDIRSDLFNHVLRLPLKTLNRHQSGDLMSRLTNDIDDVGHAASVKVLRILRLPLTASAAFIYLLHMNWRLSLICLLFAPIAMLVGVILSRLLKRNSTRLLVSKGKLQSLLQESFSGQMTIRAFHLEGLFSRKFAGRTEEMLRIQLYGAKLQAGMMTGSSISGFLLFLFSMGLGSVLIAQGRMSVGTLFAFVALVSQLVQPLIGMAGQLGGFQTSISAMERVFVVMDERADDPPRELGTPQPFHTLFCRQVSFSYDGERNALESIDLSISVGSVVAVVGPSGAGKSTLIKLLMGFYSPTSGSIFLDHQRVDNTVGWSRSQSAYVGQETFLFSGTIRENLLYGCPHAPHEDIIEAAKAAQAHDFIMSLPQNYDTDIGQFGMNLSGGQRQRMAIARALLKNAPILLLDEATAALDVETEYQVQKALRRLMLGRTTFIISHRSSTIAGADWILVMDRGSIVEQGTHSVLLRSNEMYKQMFRSDVYAVVL